MTTTGYTSEGLRHYLDILRNHRRIAITAMIIVPLAAFLFSVLQASAYQATAEVLLGGESIPANLSGFQDTTGNQLTERYVQTQAGLARSPEVVERTLKAANRRDLSIDSFLASSSVAPTTNSDFLEFSVVSNDADAAPRLATEYARQFTHYRLELDTTPTRLARKQLQGRIRQLRRNGEAGTALYSNLLSKEQELATFEALQTSKTYLVREARGAIQVKPRTRRNTVLGVNLGVLLALGFVALAHALDTRVWTVRELEAKLGLPLLSRVSPSPPAGVNGSLVMRAAPSHAEAEAYRLLRANLDFVNRDRDARVIMTTSANEGEGKSTIVANLAITYAREGKRVILVDLDLRRPALAHLLDIPESPGVVEAVLHGRGLNDVLNSVSGDDAGMARLGIIPAGGGPEKILADRHRDDVRVRARWSARWNPAHSGAAALGPLQTMATGEVVASSQLRVFLNGLREQADMVFVDGPALLGTGDAITLGSVVDAIVLVTEVGRLQQQTVDNVKRALSMCRAPTLGWVVTGTSAIAEYGVFASGNGRR